MKPVQLHRLARAELAEAVAHYEQQRPGLGLELLRQVERATERIQKAPAVGAPYRIAGYRRYVLRRFPYVIFYTELEDAIWVAAVAHGSRRPDYWTRRRVG